MEEWCYCSAAPVHDELDDMAAAKQPHHSLDASKIILILDCDRGTYDATAN